MTDVQLVIEDVLGRSPSRGDRLWVRAARTRSGAGGQVVAPVAVPIEVYDNPTVEMEPGPARVRFELRDLAVDQTREFPVTVPDAGPVTLRDILDEAYDWTPEELTAFAQLRADAVAAAERAEQAREDAKDHALAAGEDREQTGLDRVATGEDREQTGRDRVATGEDRAATGEDREATNLDREQTGLDREATGEDREATGLDREQTGRDRVSTGEDRTAAREYAESFGLTSEGVTGAPGSETTVQVSGDGPAYHLVVTTPRGDEGEQGPPGEVTTAALNAGLAGKADLTGGQIPTSQLPAIALTKPFPVADRAGMLALSAQEGDVAVITGGVDKGTFMLGDGPSSVFSSWVRLTVPDAPVQSVNGQAGTVNLGAADVGASPTGHTHTAAEVGAKSSSYVPAWSEVTGKPAAFPPATHSHTVEDLDASGSRSSSTYLRGDGVWATPAGGGGSTDAGDLAGSLTFNVDATDAKVRVWDDAIEDERTEVLSEALYNAVSGAPPVREFIYQADEATRAEFPLAEQFRIEVERSGRVVTISGMLTNAGPVWEPNHGGNAYMIDLPEWASRPGHESWLSGSLFDDFGRFCLGFKVLAEGVQFTPNGTPTGTYGGFSVTYMVD